MYREVYKEQEMEKIPTNAALISNIEKVLDICIYNPHYQLTK